MTNTNNINFIALGGLGRIGSNCYVYQHEKQILIVDCGIGFSDTPYIDKLIPSFNYLKVNKKQIQGLVITHGHEDHIGAIAYLLNKMNIPIYATKFTSELIKNKLRSNKHDLVKVIESQEEVTLGKFKVTLYPVSHSIYDSSMVHINCNNYSILHSGDFKFDNNDEFMKSWKTVAKTKVDTFVCDSTNINELSAQPSEKEIYKNLSSTVKNAKGRVFSVFFASNYYRFYSMLKACKELKRKVVINGRSMEQYYKIYKKFDLLKGLENIVIDRNEAKELNDNQVMYIVTGSQGEINASLAKIVAKRAGSDLTPKADDTFIFSSKIIPGNETSVHKIYDDISNFKSNIIIDNTDDSIHTSGHVTRDKLQQVYNMLKPSNVIPMHGSDFHLHSHANFAEERGINSIRPSNGDVISLSSEGIKKINKIKMHEYTDYNRSMVRLSDAVFKERDNLMFNGACSIVFHVSPNVKDRAQVVTHGVFNSKVINKFHKELVNYIYNGLQASYEDHESLKKSLQSDALTYFKKKHSLSPMISIHLIT